MLKRNDKIDSVVGLIWNGILYLCLGKCCQKHNVTLLSVFNLIAQPAVVVSAMSGAFAAAVLFEVSDGFLGLYSLCSARLFLAERLLCRHCSAHVFDSFCGFI
ncbi:hypothetical protein MtrunA17_Chr4g0073301 [Medicago truncatula]|nr:transmembrane protein, putative [Medicago truncatula]RHN64825.1 hypothetical protein MtrunA17_Chr4g0073301 [Medicago truncatula]